MNNQGKKRPAAAVQSAKRRRRVLLGLMFPVILIIITFSYLDDKPENKEEIHSEIPRHLIPVYKAAEAEYGVPWYLLAAHHRVETVFSTMDPMISPAGAEGHMQFMPCTFVGWSHPTCDGLGAGKIPEKDKTDPKMIRKYGGYGVDANGDGIADPWDIEDAVFSAAHYLSENGASEGKYKKAVFAYNHSDDYVKEVLYYAEKYRLQENKTGAVSSRN